MQRRWPTCPGITPRWAGCHPHAYRITISRTTHPRVSGENYASRRTAGSPYGSSPHGRGKRERSRRGGAGWRLIPARAGKTTNARMTRASPRAHPRAGGENPPSASAKVTTSGSSPRGRGKRFAASVRNRPAGLIPARAGKTWDNISSAVSSAAHPRAGGENHRMSAAAQDALGSSPRGRGKLNGTQRSYVSNGLIPARAGKTRGVGFRRRSRPAHPRAGGENQISAQEFNEALGSSPRGRGKHFLTCAFIERIGQILETLELAVSSGSYSLCDVYATDAPQDQARNTGLALPSSRAAS